MKTILNITIASLLSITSHAQSITSDKYDKKQDLRMIEISSLKIPTSQITRDASRTQAYSESDVFKSASVNFIAYGRSKYMSLHWSNTILTNKSELQSVVADYGSHKDSLSVDNASSMGRQRVGLKQVNEQYYLNQLLLTGNFSDKIQHIYINLNNNTSIVFTFTNQDQEFIKHSYILISNTLGY